MKTITWFAPARADLYEAIDYFEQQAEGLGEQFAEWTAEAIESIQRFPRLSERLRKRFRLYQLRKFRRYGILYKIGKQTIFIHRIIHLQRGPGFWKTVLR